MQLRNYTHVMNMEYKIIRVDYYNTADLVSTRYQIKQARKILGFTTWFYLKETISGHGDSFKTKISFPTIEDAESFIQNITKGNPIEGSTMHEVKKIMTNEDLLR